MVMANPVQGKLWGSEMSLERAQNNDKDGGAHGSAHETSFDDGILYLSKGSLSASDRDIADASSLQELVQDGGTISLLAGDGEDMVDMYPYEQSGDKTEWMKSNCKSLSIDFDGVGEENVGDILGLGSESKVENLLTIGGQFLSTGITEDNSIILCSDGVSLPASSISSGNEDKCSDIIPLCNMPDEINSRTDQVLCPTSSQNNRNSSNLLLGSTNEVVSSVFSDLPTSLDAPTISFTSYDTKESQKGGTAEELNQSSETNLGLLVKLETSFPNLTPASQSLLSTCTIAPSVTESGLTGGILPNFLGIDTLTTSPVNETCIISEGNAAIPENFQQNVLLSVPDTSDLTNVSVVPTSDNSAKIDLSDPGNVTLAMISVSTDKDGNSTQVVLNTSEGQQLYMFNTASLKKLPGNINCVVPMTQPVENVTAVQAPGSPNQYILFPVVNGALGNGVGDGSLIQEESEVRDKLQCSEPGCGKTFSKMAKLKIHTMQHTGERPFKCSKEGCDWAFTTAYKLKRHEESHEGKKDFYCDYEGCNRKFTTIYNLNSHRRLHTRPCTEKCTEEGCDASFPTKRHLEAHMKTHNGDEKTFPCPYPGCNAVFYSAISISTHARIHKEREAELRCNFEGCGKLFDRMCRLKQHMRQHTGEKPYKCTFEGCNWAFPTASKLKRHSAKHTNLRKFMCDQCGKKFMRPEHLKGHRITHTGNKPFTCPKENCDASFTAKSSLYVHLNKHNQDMYNLTYLCPMDGCNHKCGTKVMLRNHLIKHNVGPTQDRDFAGHDIAQLLRGYNSDEDQIVHDTTEAMGVGLEDAEGEQFREGGVEFNRDQLTVAAVSQLLSLPASISVESSSSPDRTIQPPISLGSECNTRRAGSKNSGGCARTDAQRNDDISRQARERWHQKRENEATIAVPVETDIYPAHLSNSDLLGLVKQEGEIFSAPESSLSSLSYPESGLTYVHTQLLQDDPPQTVYYSGDPIGLSGDSSDLNQSVLDMVPSHFPNTTINLNDLV